MCSAVANVYIHKLRAARLSLKLTDSSHIHAFGRGLKTKYVSTSPKHSMYAIYAYIDPQNHPNVYKYTSPMECLGVVFFSQRHMLGANSVVFRMTGDCRLRVSSAAQTGRTQQTVRRFSVSKKHTSVQRKSEDNQPDRSSYHHINPLKHTCSEPLAATHSPCPRFCLHFSWASPPEA